MVRLTCFLRSVASASPLPVGTQFDVRGLPLPSSVAAVLAAVGASSTTWISAQQLPTFFPHVDSTAIRGSPVTVDVANGTIRFFNLSQLPAGGDGSPLTAVDPFTQSKDRDKISLERPVVVTADCPRSALLGIPLPPFVARALRASGKEYTSPYWVCDKHLAAFGTKPKEGAVPVKVVNKWSRREDNVTLYYNAEQTMNPERFTPTTCAPVSLYFLHGGEVNTKTAVFLRGHTLVNKLPCDTVWFTASQLPRGIQLLASAMPCTFVSPAGELLVLYGASMTTDPQKLLTMCKVARQPPQKAS